MRRRSLIGMIGAAIVAPLVTAAKCERGETPAPDPHKPAHTAAADAVKPGDQGRDPAQPPEQANIRTVVVTAYAEDEFCPYTVSAYARDTVNGDYAELEETIVASGTFTYILPYTTGHATNIQAQIKCSKAGSVKGYVALKDGKTNKVLNPINQGRTMRVELTTKR